MRTGAGIRLKRLYPTRDSQSSESSTRSENDSRAGYGGPGGFLLKPLRGLAQPWNGLGANPEDIPSSPLSRGMSSGGSLKSSVSAEPLEDRMQARENLHMILGASYAGQSLESKEALKQDMVERASLNFSPSFLDMAERKFYIYSRRLANGDFVLNTRDLPNLLHDLKQARWFIDLVEAEVRGARREFLTYIDLLFVLNYKIRAPDEEVLESFYTFDSDGSGQLSKEELRTVLCDHGKYPFSRKDFERLFRLVDTNHSNKISLKEFMDMWERGNAQTL